MKTIPMFCTLAALALAPAAFGTSILGVDFNSDSVTTGTFSATQAGFQGINVSNTLGVGSISNTFATDNTLTSGNTSVTISAPSSQLRSRERTTTPANGGSFSESNLYRDFALSDGTDITVDLGGLNAGQTYNVRFYVYDDNIATQSLISSDQFTNTTSGTQPGPTVLSTTYGGSGAITADNQYSIAFNATANGSGHITFDELNTSPVNTNQSLPILDGILLSTATPEPASLSLLTLGGLLLLRRRK